MYLSIGKGFIILSIGLGLGVGAPVAGWVIDKYDDYDIIFYLAGDILFLVLIMNYLSKISQSQFVSYASIYKFTIFANVSYLFQVLVCYVAQLLW